MLSKKIIYFWTCDKCGHKAMREFDVMPYEDFPILRDPLEGWAKYIDLSKNSEKHWCSDCVKKMTDR